MNNISMEEEIWEDEFENFESLQMNVSRSP
jgi:hypothetical protein